MDSASVRLRLDLSYDGTDFSGWAAQPGLRTVQGSLEAAIATLLRIAEPDSARVTVGGRTDAGVHARGQVAHLDVTPAQLEKWTARRRPEEPERGEPELARIRARRLTGIVSRESPDIVVHSAQVAPSAFDARFSALRRRYEYRLIGAGMRKDPLVARYTAEVLRPLDFDAMQLASDELLGLNDFTTFCKAREGATAVRDLLRFDWRLTEDGAYAARIEADAFCHSMVRALIGAVVAVGSGRIDHGELIALRDARARTSRFTVMPARGLSLEEIEYPCNDALAERAATTRARREAVD